MQEYPTEAFVLVYGLTFFGSGLAVIARALAYPADGFRHRLFALGAFGVLHAVGLWLVLINAVASAVPLHLHHIFYTPSFLALYYFAFGWQKKWPLAAHGFALTTIGGVIAASVFVADPTLVRFVTCIVAVVLPTICAALTMMLDSAFHFGSQSSVLPRRAVAFGFILYTTMHLAVELVAFAPAPVSGGNMQFLISTAVGLISVTAIVLIAGGMLTLLGKLEAAAQRIADTRIAQLQEASAEINAKLNRVQRTGKLGCWEWNLVTGEIQWSDELQKMHGLRSGEFAGTQTAVLERVHPEDRDKVESEMMRVARQGFPLKSEHRIVKPNGRVCFVEVLGEIEVGSDGATSRMSGTTRDVTELVEAKRDLVAAKVAAEEANTAKSNFMANMSHELRTPLNAILGFSEIMEAELYGPHSNPLYRAYAADIQKSGKHLLSVIGDILSVSRFEAGKTEFNEESAINVEELLKKCERWVEGQASKGAVELRVSIPHSLPNLRGDPRLLIQAILNLLANAVKFTPKGGLVELSAGENRIGGITISVRDTGVGMTQEQIARIGERFLQFDDTKNRKFEGTGLGLSITKEYVALHGGQLEVQSTVGDGSIFSIILPPGRSVRHRARQTRAWGGAPARSKSA